MIERNQTAFGGKSKPRVKGREAEREGGGEEISDKRSKLRGFRCDAGPSKEKPEKPYPVREGGRGARQQNRGDEVDEA